MILNGETIFTKNKGKITLKASFQLVFIDLTK